MNDASPLVTLLLGIGLYLLFTYPIYVIATKSGSEYAWLAFVPIANLWLLCDIAGKEWWWVLLLLIPIINIVIAVLIWMGVAEAMSMPSWLGILMLLPGINLLVLYYIAFASPARQRY